MSSAAAVSSSWSFCTIRPVLNWLACGPSACSAPNVSAAMHALAASTGSESCAAHATQRGTHGKGNIVRSERSGRCPQRRAYAVGVVILVLTSHCSLLVQADGVPELANVTCLRFTPSASTSTERSIWAVMSSIFAALCSCDIWDCTIRKQGVADGSACAE